MESSPLGPDATLAVCPAGSCRPYEAGGLASVEGAESCPGLRWLSGVAMVGGGAPPDDKLRTHGPLSLLFEDESLECDAPCARVTAPNPGPTAVDAASLLLPPRAWLLLAVLSTGVELDRVEAASLADVP